MIDFRICINPVEELFSINSKLFIIDENYVWQSVDLFRSLLDTPNTKGATLVTVLKNTNPYNQSLFELSHLIYKKGKYKRFVIITDMPDIINNNFIYETLLEERSLRLRYFSYIINTSKESEHEIYFKYQLLLKSRKAYGKSNR